MSETEILSNTQMGASFFLLFLLAVFFVYIRDPQYDSPYRTATIVLTSVLMITFTFLGSITLCKALGRCGGVGKDSKGKPKDSLIEFGKGILYYFMGSFCYLILHYFTQDKCSYDPGSSMRWTIFGLTIAMFIINVVILIIHIVTLNKKSETTGAVNIAGGAAARAAFQ